MGQKSKTHVDAVLKTLSKNQTKTMNSVVLSSRKAVVARPANSRRSALTREEVRVLVLLASSLRRGHRQAGCLPCQPGMVSMHWVLLPGVGRYHPALLRRTCSLRGKILDHVEAPNVRML